MYIKWVVLDTINVAEFDSIWLYVRTVWNVNTAALTQMTNCYDMQRNYRIMPMELHESNMIAIFKMLSMELNSEFSNS